MSNYTTQLVAKLRETKDHNYGTAKAFAEENGLSVRSVISKINAEKLNYEAKAKVVATGGVKVTKADVVGKLAKVLGVDIESIDGLSKADMRSLSALVKAIESKIQLVIT